jgi:adenine-specific DNA-methyltransferase
MAEVFGEENYCGQIQFQKATGLTSFLLASISDTLLWYCKSAKHIKYFQLYKEQKLEAAVQGEFRYVRMPDGVVQNLTPSEIESPGRLPNGAEVFRTQSAASPGVRANTTGSQLEGESTSGEQSNWKTTIEGMVRLASVGRLDLSAAPGRMYRQFFSDFPYAALDNYWDDVRSEQGRIYVVQTTAKVIQRAMLMTTAPGDLVLDPTCGPARQRIAREQQTLDYMTHRAWRLHSRVAHLDG